MRQVSIPSQKELTWSSPGKRDKELLEQVGFKDVLCINPPDMTLETAMRPEVARRNVFETVKEYLSTLP